MFLTGRLLIMELRRSVCYKHHLQYVKVICRLEACTLRVKFLDTCLKSDIIPKFLKFRIPNNGCFDDRSVTDFQRRLLRKEIVAAKTSYSSTTNILDEKRSTLIASVRDELLPSVALYSRIERKAFRKDSEDTHAKKLENRGWG